VTGQVVDILIIDDHASMRQELKALLLSEKSYRVLDTKWDSQSALRAATELNPDIILMGLTLQPIGIIDTISRIKRQHPAIKIVALTLHDDERYVRAALYAGADAYVLKNDSLTSLLTALDQVMKGARYLSPGISDRAAIYLAGRGRKVPPPSTGGYDAR
jgi:DNA-binding NarL/FixJ family response regulator